MSREYYLTHKAEIYEKLKEYRAKNKEKKREWDRKWREEHRMSNREATRKYHERLKIEVLTHYGNGKFACVKCGENRFPCLSIDHIKGGGVAQSKIVGSGHHLYRWLKRNNYPEGFQTLCMNCQMMKKYENKEYGNQGMR